MCQWNFTIWHWQQRMLFFRFLWLTANLRCFVAKSDLSKFTLFAAYFFGQICISAIFITFSISALLVGEVVPLRATLRIFQKILYQRQCLQPLPVGFFLPLTPGLIFSVSDENLLVNIWKAPSVSCSAYFQKISGERGVGLLLLGSPSSSVPSHEDSVGIIHPLPTLPLPRHRSPNNPAKVNDFIIEIIGYIWPLVQQKWFLHASFKSEDILSQCVSRSFPITRITTLIAQDAPILHQLGLIGPFLAPGFVTMVAFYWPTLHSLDDGYMAWQ